MPLLGGDDIRDLIARASVEVYETAKFISIPGWQQLSETEQDAICGELTKEQDNPTIPPQDLRAALEALTPPPDEEDNLRRSIKQEEEARQYLDQVGCPPCYPRGYTPPFHEIPEKYADIVEYWLLRPTPGVLPAQAQDRKDFGSWRKAYRSNMREERFQSFLEHVRDRRRRHGLSGDVVLNLSLEKQTKMEDWIEFQDYHLRKHEALEADLRTDEDNLSTARVVQDAERERIFDIRVETGKKRMRKHGILLRWIEQYRVEMMERETMKTEAVRIRRTLRQRKPSSPTLCQRGPALCNTQRKTKVGRAVQKDSGARHAVNDHAGHPGSLRSGVTSTDGHPTSQKTGPAVRGDVRVAKAKRSRRNTWIENPEALKVKPFFKTLNSDQQHRASLASKHSKAKPKDLKVDRPLRRTRLQSASQSTQSSSFDTIPSRPQRRRGVERASSPDQTRRITRQQVRQRATLGGRISKPPTR